MSEQPAFSNIKHPGGQLICRDVIWSEPVVCLQVVEIYMYHTGESSLLIIASKTEKGM